MNSNLLLIQLEKDTEELVYHNASIIFNLNIMMISIFKLRAEISRKRKIYKSALDELFEIFTITDNK